MDKINETKSVVLSLEALQQKYKLLLVEYSKAISDYITSLDNQELNNTLISIKGFAFNGTKALSTQRAKNVNECIAFCNSNMKCSGATFKGNQCLLRSGDSPILNSSKDSYAIIKKNKQLLENVDKINKDLLNVNNQLLNKIENSSHLYYEQNDERIEKTKELTKNYQDLMNEREKLRAILNEYETLDETQNDKSLKLTQNYNTFYLYLFLAGILIFIITKNYSFKKTDSVIKYGGSSLFSFFS